MSITLDAITVGTQTTATTLSYSHTCSGSNRRLWVSVVGDLATDDLTNVKYNGVIMTVANKVLSTRWIYLCFVDAPATGSNTVLVTFGSSHYIASGSVSYNGAIQSGTVDASNTATAIAVTSFAPSVTAIANNCWIIGVVYGVSATLSAGANTLYRVSGDGFDDIVVFDSNGARGTGAQVLNINSSPASNIGAVIASFAPSLATVSNFLTLGVGT